jgi:hypothetical protein
VTRSAKPRGSTNKGRSAAGLCQLCGGEIARARAAVHVAECAPAHDVSAGALQQLVQLRATSPGLRLYWIDFEAKADAKLEAIDAFLRRVWLECCGHLSVFRIGGVDYFSPGYEFGLVGPFGAGVTERSMKIKLGDALCSERFEYEYDFGSTTALQLEVTGGRSGRIGRYAVRLLARNSAPVFPCATCGAPATLICPYCIHEGTDAFTCDEHRGGHGCGEQEAFLPVVNSPRAGVCAYVG